MSKASDARLLRIRLDTDMHQALIAAANTTGQTPSAVVRAALTAHLAETMETAP